MTMIERVATAIKECGPVGCEVLGRKQALEMAKAAIQAMRKPTTDMAFRGSYRLDENGYSSVEVWQAMIDAALSETSEES